MTNDQIPIFTPLPIRLGSRAHLDIFVLELTKLFDASIGILTLGLLHSGLAMRQIHRMISDDPKE